MGTCARRGSGQVRILNGSHEARGQVRILNGSHEARGQVRILNESREGHGFLSANRYVSHDFRTYTLGTVNRQSTTNLFGALAHADKSEMTALPVAHGLIVETAAVISHAKLHTPRIEYEID